MFADFPIKIIQARQQTTEASSATLIGCFAIIFVCCEVGIVVLVDLPAFRIEIQRLKSNLNQGIRRPSKKIRKKDKGLKTSDHKKRMRTLKLKKQTKGI